MAARILTFGVALFVASAPSWADEETSARDACSFAAGTIWIYEGTVKTTLVGTSKVRTKHLRWTNEVEWAEASPLRHVAVVRGSLHPVGFDGPDSAAPPSVFVCESNCVYKVDTETASAAYALAKSLVDRDSALPLNATELLNFPLNAGKDFDVDISTPPRGDHRYCWHVEKQELQTLRVRGLSGASRRQVVTLAYRTNPDHQIVEFVPGVGILRSEYVHHGTVSEARMELVEFRDGRRRKSITSRR